MGQGLSSPCPCAEESGQMTPWQPEKGVVTMAVLDRENGAAKVVSEQVVRDKKAVSDERPPSDVQEQRTKWPEVFYFEVELSKFAGEDSFGIAHVPMQEGGGCLILVDFWRDGPVSRWNHSQESQGKWSHQIMRGDRIVRVGSASDVFSMRAALRQESVRLDIERWPETIALRLTKNDPDGNFGIYTDRFEKKTGVQELYVSKIVDGTIKEWNRMAADSNRLFEVVVPGSQIIRVDSVDGPADKLVWMLTERMDVEVVFRRPAPEHYL